jgi:hypothetical protein
MARFEVEVDTALADAYERLMEASAKIGQALDALHSYAGDRRAYQGKRPVWKMTEEEVRAAGPKPYYAESWEKTLARVDQGRADYQATRDEIAALDEKYTGWTRFYLVQNVGGHIHRNRNCSTCHPTTRYGWLPQLSGLTEADAVADQGPRLCSVCYPSAPIEWTLGLPTEQKDYCPGSGQADGATDWRARYVKCPVCSQYVAKTSNGIIRKHTVKKGKGA